MRIATWNVNSVKARLERLLAWLDKQQPDILCLQELKVVDEAFPVEEISSAGYHSAVLGQKTYNGVAILSKGKPANIIRGMQDNVDDPQSRLISAEIEGIRVICAYVPNGKEVGSDSWEYKLAWMERFLNHLSKNFTPNQPLILCGDLNVAVDDKDVARPEEWADSVLCHEDIRTALGTLRDWGLEDVFRKHHPEGGVYSWWDYRMLAFPKNRGLRIDHLYATAPLASKCVDAMVDRDERKGSKDSKPSDHAPVIAVFEQAAF